MKWTKRSDLEREMVSFNAGARLCSRSKLAAFLGRHPKDKKISMYLRGIKKIDGKYPIADLSEVIWNGGQNGK